MKKYTYTGNLGMPFEDFITYANRRYQARKEAAICKIPTKFIPIRDRFGRIVSCKVEEKSTVDYIGRVKDRPIAIEAKHTSSDSIRWHEVKNHQAEFLDDFMNDGEGISIVLVSFKLERFFAVPWPYWKAARDQWTKAQREGKRKAELTTVVHRGPGWTTNGKASVKITELLPEWEVKMDGKVGLDYLRRYL